MPSFAALAAQWPDVALAQLARLSTPQAIAAWLAAANTSDWGQLRAPLSVLRDSRCNPLDAGLFAAAALRQLGHPPRVVVGVWAGAPSVAALFTVARRVGAIGVSCGQPSCFWPAQQPSVRALQSKAMLSEAPAKQPFALANCDVLDWLTDDSGAETALHQLLARYGL